MSAFHQLVGRGHAAEPPAHFRVHLLELRKGEALSRTMCQQSGGFIILEGRMCSLLPQVLEEWYGPGDLMGFSLLKCTDALTNVIAAQNSKLEYVPAELLEWYSAHCPEGMLQLFRKIHNQLECMHRRVGLMHGVVQDSDVYQFLKQLEEKYSVNQDGYLGIEATMDSWARYLGISATTFRRVIRRLRAEGKLERKGIRIKLLKSRNSSLSFMY